MTASVRTYRHRRVRARVRGSALRPRASIFRSTKRIVVQLVDDERGHTFVYASGEGRALGLEVARQARAAEIRAIVFDRGGYRYHGRIKAVAEGMREGGLIF